MKTVVISVTAAALLSACASSPQNITATYVSPLQYQNFTCQQLGLESQRIGARVAEVTGQQQQKANNDAVATGVAVVLFWPAVFFLGGGDQSAELSRLKGESDAIQQAAIQKNCMSQPAPAPAS